MKYLLECILFPRKNLNFSSLKNELTGKTVIITGATFGIGERLSYLLAVKTVKLILIGRTLEKLEKLQLDLTAKGAIVEVYSIDLRDKNQLDIFTSKLINSNDRIDIIVSNAGKSIRRSVFDALDRFHDYQRTININYLAPVQLCLNLMPLLEKSKGQIINISAINVLLLPMPKWSAYQSSKIAADHFFRSIGPELITKGITISTLYLPLVKTRMMKPTKKYASFPAMIPDEVAKLIGKIIITKKRRFKPWWTIFAQAGSFLFQPIIDWGLYNFNKK